MKCRLCGNEATTRVIREGIPHEDFYICDDHPEAYPTNRRVPRTGVVRKMKTFTDADGKECEVIHLDITVVLETLGYRQLVDLLETVPGIRAVRDG